MSVQDVDPDFIDPAEVRFRMDSVPAGAWVTFILCAAGILYNIDKWYVPTSLQRYTSG